MRVPRWGGLGVCHPDELRHAPVQPPTEAADERGAPCTMRNGHAMRLWCWSVYQHAH